MKEKFDDQMRSGLQLCLLKRRVQEHVTVKTLIQALNQKNTLFITSPSNNVLAWDWEFFYVSRILNFTLTNWMDS